MRLKFVLLCNHAAYLENRTPLIVGVFDTMRMIPGVPGAPVALLPFHIVISVGATSFEAGKHPITIRIVNEDGHEGARMTIIDVPFTVVTPGDELGAYIIQAVHGMQVAQFGDYVFEILSGEQRLGDVNLRVVPLEMPVAL